MTKIILTILFFTSLEKNINAQSWSTLGAGIGAGYYHSVHAFATYNGELYAGGYFTSAGGTPANNIAKWNGTNWSSVGTGINGYVYSLCVFNGELYAGGSFLQQEMHLLMILPGGTEPIGQMLVLPNVTQLNHWPLTTESFTLPVISFFLQHRMELLLQNGMELCGPRWEME